MKIVEPWIKVEKFDGIKIMKRIDAKNIVKTFCWIAQAGEDGVAVLEPILNKDKGTYECIINLPLIEKTVIIFRVLTCVKALGIKL